MKETTKFNEKQRDVGIVDSTEFPVCCPSDDKVQYLFYSGKKKKHTIKYEIVISPYDYSIISFSGGVGGAVFHDLPLSQVGSLALLNPGQKMIGDLAYIGDDRVITPIKRSGGKELTKEEIKFNHNIGGLRVAVENVIGRIGVFGITKHKWRHKHTLHPIAVGVCVFIVAIELHEHPIRRWLKKK